MAGYGINDQESAEPCVEWMVRDALEKLGDTKPELAVLHMTANRDVELVYNLVREALGDDVIRARLPRVPPHSSLTLKRPRVMPPWGYAPVLVAMPQQFVLCRRQVRRKR